MVSGCITMEDLSKVAGGVPKTSPPPSTWVAVNQTSRQNWSHKFLVGTNCWKLYFFLFFLVISQQLVVET